jgi:hypothetical protein
MKVVARTMAGRPIEGKASAERRTHKRFEVQHGAIASAHLTAVGEIINISHGGLEFQYVASRERSKESCRLSISLADSTFNLGMIPFKVAWDVPMPETFSCGPFSLRYCGVEFGNLADYQKLGLRFFVHNYTATTAES